MVPMNQLLGPQTRRDMLKLASVGALGVSASGWMDVLAHEVPQTRAVRGKAKNVIVLFMSGGPAHTWTFDMKEEVRNGCPYEKINTSVSGIQVSEFLPQVAKQMHHLALVRGMSTDIADHEAAHYLMRTGFRQMAGVVHPHIGSTAVSQIVREDTGLPSFVLLKPGSGGLRGVSAGFLNPATRPMILQDVGRGIANLQNPAGMEIMRNRMNLLQGIDQAFVDEYQADAARAHLAGYQKAAQLMDLEKAQAAFQLEREPMHVRQMYGDTPFGRQCLGARRLIENGVRFVEVMHPDYWDTHGSQLQGQKKLSHVLDQPMAALIKDLNDRGMLEDTLVVWMGEFGRDYSGGNHYAKAWTTIFAGGGVRGGQVVGATDNRGMNVTDRPVKVKDFAATIFNALGINHTQRTWVKGRPIGFVDGEPNPVNELFA